MQQRSSTQKEALDMPEQRTCGRVHDSSASQELTLAEAAQHFNVSLGTLRRLVAAGGIAAHKVNGVRGREWRVTSSTLRDAGYVRRVTDRTDADSGSEVRRLTEALMAERARNADLDGRLGYALLTVGRLRGRLRDVGIDPDQLFGTHLKAGSGEGR